MESRIEQALRRLFDKHRIVFWYDAKRELRADFEAVSLEGVGKLEIANNEFGIKHRILREQPDEKFLLYRDGPQPEDLDNWLLDVQLAQGEFRTDQVAIWLAELDLGLEFADVVQQHLEFFHAAKRKEALKKLLKPDDTAGVIRLKMVAVCAGAEPRMDSILESLLQDVAENADDRFSLITGCALDGFVWTQLTRHYGYASPEPSIRDFAVTLFKDCYFQHFTSHGPLTTGHLSSDALVFLKRWKDSRAHEDSFEKLSNECAGVLGIEADLSKRDVRDLIEIDYFELIDRKILSDLVKAVVGRTVSAGDVALWVRQRRQGHWYADYRDLYDAIEYAAGFIQLLGEANLEMNSLADGVQRYCATWYQLDQRYRKFIYHVRKSGQSSLLEALAEQVENLYSTAYLLKVNDRWQAYVDAVSTWGIPRLRPQRRFFEHWIQPFLSKGVKVCVVISDALRYEIGEELLTLIRQEDRYSAELEPALSTLPSYTQLGMAALLPHRELTITDNAAAAVLVDGLSSQGTTNRDKILKTALDGAGAAVTAEQFMAMNRDDSRDLLKSNTVVYVYHNCIDHTGDKIHSEGQAFEAAEQTLQELLRLVKKLTAANASNILITADHGFIYQHRAIDDSDFSAEEPEGDAISYRDRRFVIGKGLRQKPGLKHFSSQALGLAGDLEVQLSKSINRLRLKGSGSRFVHGGASLQEVIIPVLKVNKKRQSDVTQVEVDILRGASSVITSGQLAVVLYQAQPVTDKVQPRALRAGIYTEAGELISDSHELIFDLTSDNPRERELQVRFVLSRAADAANSKEVVLRLEERHAGTTHYKEYKAVRYLMRRSFTSDFDF
ncbi:BREX-1 system phosphatase PglZ type A [Halochromatium roseum]|uniref:BREX-1 system phosphatase PglZ type A n=1 Tax=Halochromatium roseum TaxID=391920 RepID=UPI001914C1F6|nr:BREX-1 system phosphatase PglZ type A [Halochromatium roseum]MBK5941356.1 TIGR02687 family protein [Halochromatium roseum]